MKSSNTWKKQIKQIAKDFTNLTALANTHNISSPDLDLDKLKNSINKLQDLIASIEQADRNQGLFSDRSDAQNNSYLEAPSEDFITFKDKFEKASKDNGIYKTDQLEKLREALTGNAASHIPPADIDSVDSAWTILEKAFGNALNLLNFCKAAALFLPYKKAVESILRLGDRSNTLGMQGGLCNTTMIYKIYANAYLTPSKTRLI